MNMLLFAAVAQAVVPNLDLPPAGGDPCAPYGPALAYENSLSTTLTIGDQARMADIGRSSPGPAPNAFDLSPDGTRIAFRVKRANPDTNSYCQTLLVAAVDGSGEVVEVDRGGEFIRDDFSLREFTVTMAGWDKPNTPRWSPTGEHIAYLRREGGSTQVWLADPTGAASSMQATSLVDDVDDFAFTDDGEALVVATRPGIRASLAAIQQEGLRGFLFDDRFSPQFADHPLSTGEMAFEFAWVSLIDGASRAATSDEMALLVPPRPADVPANARAYTAGPDGYAAWLEPTNPDHLLSPTRLVFLKPDGHRLVCESQLCEGIRGLWWEPDGEALFILQKTGWANSQTALRRWSPGDTVPRRVIVTDDVFTGCDVSGSELVCTREGSLQPRRIVAIDMQTGSERIIHDPNPNFRNLRLGPVERFRFRNA